MPTNEAYTNEALIHVTWTSPLTVSELATCFHHLAHELSTTEQPVDIVFDLAKAGHIPVDAPHMAHKAGFLNHRQLRSIGVIGMSRWARMLANIASGKSSKPIESYRSLDEAVTVLGGY